MGQKWVANVANECGEFATRVSTPIFNNSSHFSPPEHFKNVNSYILHDSLSYTSVLPTLGATVDEVL